MRTGTAAGRLASGEFFAILGWRILAATGLLLGSLFILFGTADSALARVSLPAATTVAHGYDYQDVPRDMVSCRHRSKVEHRYGRALPPCEAAALSTSSDSVAPNTAGLVDDVHPSTPVGRSGLKGELNVTKPNAPTEIGGRSYSGHALDRMQGRGLPPSVVEDAITSGRAVPGRGGTTIHYSPENNVSVVVNSEGKVVTVSPGEFKP